MEYISSPTTLCQKNIESKTPNKFLHQTSFCVFNNFLHSLSLLAAIHLFISSHDEIKDFCSMDKKTGRRYVLRFPFSTITTICEDILMRNAYMKYFRSETFCGRTHCAVPLRPAFATSYILKSLSRKDPQISHIQICEEFSMRNG